MKNNVKTYLGFAVKKGSVIYGLDAMERQNKAPYAVLLCPTAAQNTAKKNGGVLQSSARAFVALRRAVGTRCV